jgi:pimeloyl-ACP methyl ester carboxylesterase
MVHVAESGAVEVGGLRISYVRAGDGPPLLLLHGGLSDHREWRLQMDDLADDFTVVAWDAPGCGGSTDPPPTFRMPDYADVLDGFLDAIGLSYPHVLGLSWGSALALELYRRHPDRPRTLVLSAAYAGWAGSLAPDVVRARLSTSLRDLELPPEAFVRTWVPSLFTSRATREMIDESVAIMASFHPDGVRPMLHALAEADLRDVLPTIEVSTLLLYGAEDERSPLDVARAMHAAIPRSTLVVLPDVGHQANIEAPDRFNAAVREFIRSR